MPRLVEKRGRVSLRFNPCSGPYLVASQRTAFDDYPLAEYLQAMSAFELRAQSIATEFATGLILTALYRYGVCRACSSCITRGPLPRTFRGLLHTLVSSATFSSLGAGLLLAFQSAQKEGHVPWRAPRPTAQRSKVAALRANSYEFQEFDGILRVGVGLAILAVRQHMGLCLFSTIVQGNV